jgi:hypothetical protein
VVRSLHKRPSNANLQYTLDLKLYFLVGCRPVPDRDDIFAGPDRHYHPTNLIVDVKLVAEYRYNLRAMDGIVLLSRMPHRPTHDTMNDA